MLELCLLIIVTRAIYEIVKLIYPNAFKPRKKNTKRNRVYTQSRPTKRQIHINTQYLKRESAAVHLKPRHAVKVGVLRELSKPCRVDLHRAPELRCEKERKKVA